MLVSSNTSTAAATTTAATTPYLAIGVISAPQYAARRDSLRASWLRWELVGRGQPVRVLFVVRSSGAPDALDCQLNVEQRRFDDIARVAVAWNESRLRGPVLSLAAWLELATRQFSAASFVAKMDDDAYLHVPDLVTLLRTIESTPSHAPFTYLGPMSWFHWHPNIFERSGFGWYFGEAYKTGAFCRNATAAEERCGHAGCGGCVGPFPFAAGFLLVLSTSLAEELAASPVLRHDLRALRAASTIVNRFGKPTDMVMEDIWLGSLLHRRPPSRPVRYVALSEVYGPELVSDRWGMRVRQSALLVHIKGKQIERFIGAHDFMNSTGHCSQPQRLSCDEGCEAFVVTEADVRFQGPVRVVRPRVTGRLRDARINGSVICSARQQRAVWCRLRPAGRPRPACRNVPGNYWGVNLLPRVQHEKGGLLAPVRRSRDAALRAGTAPLLANACKAGTLFGAAEMASSKKRRRARIRRVTTAH